MGFIPKTESSGFTPKQQGFTPKVGGFTPKQRDEFKMEDFAKQVAIGFGNEALLGMPLYLTKKFNGEDVVKDLESQNQVERVGRGIGTTAGMIVGLPKTVFAAGIKGAELAGRTVLGADRIKKLNSFTKNVIKGSAGATAFEMAHAPEETYKEKIISVPTAALFGGVVGGLADKLAPAVSKFLDKKGLIKNDAFGGVSGLDKLNKGFSIAETVDEPVKMKVKSIANGFEAEFTDRFAPIRHLAEDLESKVGKFPFKIGINEQVNRVLGSQSIIKSYVDRYGEILRKAGKDTGNLRNLKILQRSQELVDRGIKKLPFGLKPSEIQESLNKLKDQLGPEGFLNLERIAQQHRGLLNKMIVRLNESGIIDDKSLKNILDKNQFYTPFEVVDFLETQGNQFARGSGFSAGIPSALKRLQGSEREVLNPIDAEVRYIFRAVNAAEKNLAKRAIVEQAQFSPEARTLVRKFDEKVIPRGFQKVSVFRNGIKEEWAVEENLANAINGMDAKAIDLMTKFMGKFSSALRMGATSLNTAFTIPNFFRDVLNAKVTAKSLFDVNLGMKDVTRGFLSVLKKDKWFRNWERNAGGFSGLQQIVRKSAQGVPAAERALAPSISSKVISSTNPFKFLADVSEVSELTTRLGVFRAALREGKSVPLAITAARNATIDFARMGNTMQLANLWVPFLNARIQGALNVMRGMKKNPKEFFKVSSGIIGVPYLATYFNNVTRFPHVWENIRQFEKEDNFIFIWGDAQDEEGRYTQLAKIPKGDIGRLLTNPIEEVLEFSRGAEPDFAQTALKFVSDLSPIDFERDGQFSAETLGSSILPPPIKALGEGISGVNYFTGKEIIPRNLQEAPATEQYAIKTSPIAIQIGKLVGVSPLKIENAVGTMFGTLGRQMLNPMDPTGAISKRFLGASGTEEQQRQFETLEDIISETEVKDAKQFRKVRLAFERFNTLPDPLSKRQLIASEFAGDAEGLKDFLKLVGAQATGENPIVRKLKSRPVEDRLRFINEYTRSMDTDVEKFVFLKLMFDNKVITQDSLKRLK